MAKVGDTGRYGVVVMQTVDGTWWWCELLGTLDLVPKGGRNSVDGMALRDRENNLNGVMRTLAREILRKSW